MCSARRSIAPTCDPIPPSSARSGCHYPAGPRAGETASPAPRWACRPTPRQPGRNQDRHGPRGALGTALCRDGAGRTVARGHTSVGRSRQLYRLPARQHAARAPPDVAPHGRCCGPEPEPWERSHRGCRCPVHRPRTDRRLMPRSRYHPRQPRLRRRPQARARGQLPGGTSVEQSDRPWGPAADLSSSPCAVVLGRSVPSRLTTQELSSTHRSLP
jgi:hypothetical protein